MTEIKNGPQQAGVEQTGDPREQSADTVEPSAATVESAAASAGSEKASEAVARRDHDAGESREAGQTPGTEGHASAFGAQANNADALWASLKAEADEPAVNVADQDTPGERREPDFTLADPTGGDAVETFEKEGERTAPVAAKKQGKAARPSAGPFNGKSLGPVLVSTPLMEDENGALLPTPPTIASRLFTFLSLIPIVLPVLLLAAQVAFTLDTRSLWYSDEVRYANAFQNMLDTGNWLVLQLNGAWYPDKPPLFFWFLQGISDAAAQVLPGGIAQPALFFVGVAVSGLLCLLASHALASLVGRVDRRTVLAADLVLVGGLAFAGLLHYLRMDLLFAALITLSHVLLFHAWVRDKAPLLMILGFLAAGAAVLVKGPLGLAFPILAGLCFLLWQRRFSRLFRLDTLLGLIVGLAVPGVWLALAWMNVGDDFLNNILYKQVLSRALNTWHHAQSWYFYLLFFPLIWLPWTLVFLFLPWSRLFGKGMREGLKASRTKDAAGIAYLWCAFLPGFILLSAVSIKLPIYCLPLFPPLAILCGRAVMQMRPFAAACLQYSLAILLAVFGISLMIMPIVPLEMLHLPVMPRGTILLGGVCLVFACALGFLVRSRRTEGFLLLTALFTTAFAFPGWSVTAPSLDSFLSPKAQAEVIKKYREAGYYPASFKVYPGTYAYYAGGNVKDYESWEEAQTVVREHEKVILALRASFWDTLANKPAGFVEVDRQIIAERAYVLVARPPLGEPAKAVEEAPSGTNAVAAPEPSTQQPLAPQPETMPEQPQQTEQTAPEVSADGSPAAEELPTPAAGSSAESPAL